MTNPVLPIEYLDNGKVARDKINNSFNNLSATVASYRPHIENGVRWIGNTNTGVKAVGDSIDMKVEDGYIRYKSSSVNNWTQIIAIADLKGDKGDPGTPGAAATITVGTTTTGAAGSSASVTNSGSSSEAVFNFTIPQGAKGQDGADGTDGASIVSAEFDEDDIVFTKDDSNTVTLEGAKTTLTGPQGEPGQDGEDGTDGNGITSVTSSKSGKITTVTMNFDEGDPYSFQIEDGADGQGSGDMVASTYDPTNVGGDAFDYSNFHNTPTLGTAAACNTGTSNGNIPVLDSNGKLNTTTLPGVALTDTFTVTNKSDLTSLSSADQGDIGIVTSESKTYVLSQAPYSTAANWKELLSPTDAVTSVNSKTGAVTLNADDISDSTTTKKFVTTQTAYTSKGTSKKVATITTNTLGQVTSISETNIAFPVTSVNGSTGAVTGLQEALVSGTNIKTINNESLLGSGDITISGGGDTIEYVTQAEYTALLPGAESDGKHYFIYSESGPTPIEYTITGSTTVGSFTPGSFSDLQGFFISPDGLNAYATFWNSGNGRMAQYSLSTAWDISTASQTQYISLAKPNGFCFSNDGTYMFYSTEDGMKIVRYSLSTPRDISTATQDSGQSITVDSSKFAVNVCISEDGSYIWYAVDTKYTMHQYELTTPFDLTTATNHKTLSISEAGPGVAVKNNGKYMYRATSAGAKQYELATAYDITSTATEIGIYSTSISEHRALFVSNNCEYWAIGVGSGITQYEAQPIS